MKVNITGRGICPVIGSMLPCMNVDVSEGALVEILKNRSIRVFDAVSNVPIHANNYKTFLMRRTVAASAQVETPIKPTKVSANKRPKKSTKPAEQLIEKAQELGIPTEVEETPAPVVEETPVAVDEVVAPVETNDVVEEETPAEVVEADVAENNNNNNRPNKHNKHKK